MNSMLGPDQPAMRSGSSVEKPTTSLPSGNLTI